MSKVVICGVRKGRWSKPIPYKEAGIKWVSRSGKPAKEPKRFRCEHPDHTGRRRWFPVQEMFYQEWEMTEQEIDQAIEEFDVFSLEMLEEEGRLICKECAKKEGL